MVPQTYDEAMRRVLADEGGYCNDAADPGGPTKYGITIFDVRKYLKPGATAADVKAISVADAMTIYRKHYANPSHYDDLPAGLDYAVLDYGINSGVGRSGKVLRRLVGLPADTSTITDEVLRAVAKRDPKALCDAMWDERLRFLQSLKTWPVFGKGWGRRVGGGKAASRHMAVAVGAPPLLPVALPDSVATQAAGKGAVPEPAAAKNAVKVGVPSAGVAGGTTWWDWVVAHPYLTVALAVAAVVAVGLVVQAIDRWHKSKQEAPTPGLVPVPELRAA